jgi:hypothetical protein
VDTSPDGNQTAGTGAGGGSEGVTGAGTGAGDLRGAGGETGTGGETRDGAAGGGGSGSETGPGPGSPLSGRLRALVMIAIFDIGGPLALYSLLRRAGLSTVTALVLSGVFPAAGVAINAITHRRLDVVGALVLAGIAVGTVLGLISHSARLVLVEGSVPTAIFGVACLVSLRARHPLVFSIIVEFVGPDTAKGREMILFWHHPGFRRAFRTITAVWGVGFLLEAAVLIVIVYNTSTGAALATSKVMPYVWAGALVAWTVAFGAWQKRKTERQDAASAAEVPEPAADV